MGRDGAEWGWMGRDGAGWGWIGRDGAGWGWIGSDGAGWGWIGLDRVRWDPYPHITLFSPISPYPTLFSPIQPHFDPARPYRVSGALSIRSRNWSSLGVMMISVRRFSARPEEVELVAMGLYSPLPPAVRREGSMPKSFCSA